MYKAIIFDFFDVIHGDPFQGWLRTHGLKREGTPAKASEDLDHGLINWDEFAGRLAEATGQTKEAVHAEFNRHAVVNEGLVDLIGELAKSYRVGLLSNAQSVFLRDILAEHNLERLFHYIVISSEVGMIKPNPEIFRHILEKLGVVPAEAIFIDDNVKNTEAAEKVGIRGVQYTDLHKLKQDLASLGVKLP